MNMNLSKREFQSAIWLIRNIEQRKRTLYRVSNAIIEKQRDFLDEGLTALKPFETAGYRR